LFISARSGKNLDQLIAACLEQIADALDAVELLVPHTRYDVIAKLHATGHVQFEESRDEGVFIQGRFAPAQAGLYKAYLVK
jgi:GTP-binding protein HflX